MWCGAGKPTGPMRNEKTPHTHRGRRRTHRPQRALNKSKQKTPNCRLLVTHFEGNGHNRRVSAPLLDRCASSFPLWREVEEANAYEHIQGPTNRGRDFRNRQVKIPAQALRMTWNYHIHVLIRSKIDMADKPRGHFELRLPPVIVSSSDDNVNKGRFIGESAGVSLSGKENVAILAPVGGPTVADHVVGLRRRQIEARKLYTMI